MPPTRLLALLLAAAAASPCQAQEFIDHAWSFLEVTAGTNTPVPAPNGRLDPGEGARISLTVTISPAVGSTTTYTPPPPPGIGIIAGLGHVFTDLHAAPGAAGTWSLIERPPEWALGDHGYPQANGSVTGIQAGQFITPPNVANPQNPIPDIWRGVWTPNSYAPRSVVFLSGPGGLHGLSSILIQYATDPMTGAPLYVGKFLNGQYGQVTIPVVPAPSCAPALLLLFAASRAPRRTKC